MSHVFNVFFVVFLRFQRFLLLFERFTTMAISAELRCLTNYVHRRKSRGDGGFQAKNSFFSGEGLPRCPPQISPQWEGQPTRPHTPSVAPNQAFWVDPSSTPRIPARLTTMTTSEAQ